MTISGEDISRVTNLLKVRPRGMSIAAIAKELHMNRNSVAKYLDLLTASGAVELTRVGPAKLYFTAPRVPVSGMINLSSDFFIMLDADLRVHYVNNNVLAFEDRTRPEVLLKNLDDLSFALTAGDEIQRYLHSAERDEIFQRDVEVRKGEETFHFRVKIISTVYENGTQGITILATDITTETEQRMAIEASEENLRAVMATAPAIILTVNREGSILYANRGAGEYSPEDVTGTSFFQYVPPDQQEILRHHLEKTFATGLPTTYEVRGYGQEGPGTAWYESHMGPVFQDGKINAVTLISLDITGPRKAREALSESEARYRAVVEDQTEIVFRYRPDGIFTFANDAFCRLTGKTRDQVLGSNWAFLVTDRDLPEVRDAYRSLSPEHPRTSVEHQITRSDGEFRWIQANILALFDDKGHPLEYQVVGRDITEKKNAERSLRESEARYRAVVEDQTEWIVRFRTDGIFTFANDAFCRDIGKSWEEIVGVPFPLPLSDEAYALTRKTYRSLTKDHPTTYLETTVTKPDGSIHSIAVTFRGLFEEDGTPREYQAVARDITDRRKAEEMARTEFQSFPVPTYVLRKKGDDLVLSDYNEAAFRDTHGTIPRLVGRTAKDLWGKYPSVLANMERCLAEKTTIEEELQYTFIGTGEKKDLFLRYAHLPPDGILAYTIDMTQQKMMEKALRASEEQFREMAETSPFPIAIVNGDGRYRYLNRRFTELFGYTLDDVPTGRRWFEQAFPDTDLRREAISAWKGDLADSRPGMVRPRQFPVKCRNGECREIIFRPVTLREGAQYITYEDVTERFHALDSLRQSEARFRHLFNSMRCCFTLVEPVLDEKGMPVDLTFLEVNSAMERLSGRIREDLVGRQMGEVLPNTPPELISAIGAVALTGYPKKLAILHPGLDRILKIRAYSPWKGQCALIFKVVAPGGQTEGVGTPS
ncbi:MAG: PAS domain S-box protein [Methanomicrobiales archaeon]|nr:PAS domain S-box protein [Methanomicrobiales archaeon]